VALRYANLLDRLTKYEAAADWFYTAWKLNPKAKGALDAMHDAVMDYLRVIDLKSKGAKSEETQDLAPRKIPKLAAKAIRAAKAYMENAQEGDPDMDQTE